MQGQIDIAGCRSKDSYIARIGFVDHSPAYQVHSMFTATASRTALPTSRDMYFPPVVTRRETSMNAAVYIAYGALVSSNVGAGRSVYSRVSHWVPTDVVVVPGLASHVASGRR